MDIFLINARASLLSLFIVIGLFIVFYLKTYTIKRATILNILVLVMSLIISFTSINIFLKKSNAGGRFVSTTERIQQINGNDASINLRFLFWRNALQFTKSKPVLGIGLGNWRIESIPFEPKGSLSVSLHAHNDFLEFFAETGVISGFVYLSIFLILFFINLKRVLKAKDNHTKTIAFLALMLLVVFGVDSFFNFPFYRPTMQLGFCILMALTLVNDDTIGETEVKNVKSKGSFLLVLITIIPLYFIYQGYKTAQLEYLILSDNVNIDNNLATILHGDDVVNHEPKYPNVFTTAESFIEHAGVYYIYEKRYDEATKSIDEANKINPYLASPDFYKYVIAMARGKVDSAYFYIKSSFYRRPSVSRSFLIAIDMASLRKDTLEILKMYKTVSAVEKRSENWDKTFTALKTANYSDASVNIFMKQGMKDFPKDSIVTKRYNNTLISKYIVEGQALFGASKHEEALQTYYKALKIDPTNVAVMQNIGFYYYNLGNTNQAITYFLKALSTPGLSGGQTEYYLAQCYIKNNDKIKACTYLNIAKEKNFPQAQASINQYCK